MDVFLMVFYGVLLLSFLVVIHEGGHYLASRAFGVRVMEFMVGLPGPNVGITRHGTKFGVTPILLGGYARVCGMEAGEESPHLPQVAASVYRRGEALMEDVARDCGITCDEAYRALEELAEWGTIRGPRRSDKYNTYRTPSSVQADDGGSFDEGQPRPVPDDLGVFIDSERTHTYRSLPFWKRAIILVAGPGVNLLFAMLMFVVVYSVVGVDVTHPETGELVHVQVDPGRSIMAGFAYIGMVGQAVLGLFNPATVAETVSNSSSVVGVAVMSKAAVEAGALDLAMFTAMVSVSLGVVNLLPIPPLDGGRLIVEVYQRIRRRFVSQRTLNAISFVGIAAFSVLFVVMLNQDIQRFVFGNW